MSEDESIRDVAAEIAAWQCAALKLPLPDVQDLASTWLHALVHTLNTFNRTYLDKEQAEDALVYAVMEVARQATAAAIFTLGARQRIQQAAKVN